MWNAEVDPSLSPSLKQPLPNPTLATLCRDFYFPKAGNPRREMSDMDKAVWRKSRMHQELIGTPLFLCPTVPVGTRWVEVGFWTNILKFCLGSDQPALNESSVKQKTKKQNHILLPVFSSLWFMWWRLNTHHIVCAVCVKQPTVFKACLFTVTYTVRWIPHTCNFHNLHNINSQCFILKLWWSWFCLNVKNRMTVRLWNW